MFSLNSDSHIGDSVVRIAQEQIGRAIQEVEHPTLDRHEVVHQVRKRCKKLRALLRLARLALGTTYRRENACFRDAARSLSYLRDAQTLVECLDDLTAGLDGELDPFRELRKRLVERRDRLAEDSARLEDGLEVFRVTLREADDRLLEWTLSEQGFAAVSGGLRETYKRGRKAMRAAYANPSAERFHEWRKLTKYHAHHLQLLRLLWKPVLRAQQREAEQLADLLGNDHDLEVLRKTLLDEPAAFGDERGLGPLLDLMTRRHQELRRQARILGARVYSEQPDALVARFTGFWHASAHERVPAPPTSRSKAPGAAAAHLPDQLHRVG